MGTWGHGDMETWRHGREFGEHNPFSNSSHPSHTPPASSNAPCPMPDAP
ncbi:MAG: hypothetical protein F6J93_15325 [Oscillatoria sp. SIO1A7]|nr:hypothetical protein [Oscillatoria sp. SIO1A7]